MPKLTPQELREARKRKELERQQEAEEQAESEQRQAEEKARQEQEVAAHREWVAKVRPKHDQLVGAASAVYDELSKQSAKRPDAQVTDRTVARVNMLIGAVHGFLAEQHDDSSSGIEPVSLIVPAGDNPETRDVVVTLRELLEELACFRRSRLSNPDDFFRALATEHTGQTRPVRN